MLELVEANHELVILKNECKTTLDVAKHPYLSLDIDYISITRGRDHILTIVYKDGHTSSFEWGDSGATLISDSLSVLKERCISFLRKSGVFIGLRGDPVHVRSWETGHNGKLTVRIEDNEGNYDVSFLPLNDAMNLMNEVRMRYGI